MEVFRKGVGRYIIADVAIISLREDQQYLDTQGLKLRSIRIR